MEINYNNILTSFRARTNCLASHDPEMQVKAISHEIDIEDLLDEELPCGSGIDGKWNYKYQKNFILCENCWYYMDEHGFYDGNYRFDIKIRADRRDIFGHVEWGLKVYTYQKTKIAKERAKEIRDYLVEQFAPIMDRL